MNICILTENNYKGGLDTFIINIVNSWPHLEDDITLICNKGHPGLVTIIKHLRRKIKVKTYSYFFTKGKYKGFQDGTFIKYRILRVGLVLLNRMVEYPFLALWYLLTLSIKFKKSNYDRLLVVNGGYPASLICRISVIAWKISGKKSLAIMNFHSTPTKTSAFMMIPEMFVDYFVVKYSRKIVAVSNVTLKLLRKRRMFENIDHLIYIHNGVEDPKCIYNTTDDFYLKDNQKYCLMLATYHMYKGHDFVTKAFSKVVEEFPNIKLLMFGHGKKNEKIRIRNQIDRLPYGNNIYLGDFLENPACLIKNATVLLVPSQSLESFGLTIIEAMALETPIVATDVGGIPEVIGDSNSGVICSKHDFTRFGASIIKILTDDDLAYEMGINGRKTYEKKYRAEIMAKKYSEILQ